MEPMLFIFVLVVALTAILTIVSVSAPGKLSLKIVSIATAAALMPAAYLGLGELLSRPKPISLEWAQHGIAEATLLASRLDEDKAIYVWLEFDGVPMPRAYAMPWSQQRAQELQDAQRAAEKNGSTVRVRQPFEQSLDESRQRFFEAPQPRSVPKTIPDVQPLAAAVSINAF